MKDEDVVVVGEEESESGESSDPDADEDALLAEEEKVAVELEQSAQRNLGGRPALRDPDVDAPVAAGFPFSLGHLLTDLFSLSNSNNLSQHAATQLFDLLRTHLPPTNTMPNHRHATKMLLNRSPVKARHYAVCQDDCFMNSQVDLNDPNTLSRDISKLRESKCPHCHKRMADNKGVFYKVGHRATVVCKCAHVLVRHSSIVFVHVCVSLCRNIFTSVSPSDFV
jgi:hypothetical protein